MIEIDNLTRIYGDVTAVEQRAPDYVKEGRSRMTTHEQHQFVALFSKFVGETESIRMNG